MTERISRNAEPIDLDEFARVVGEIAALEEPAVLRRPALVLRAAHRHGLRVVQPGGGRRRRRRGRAARPVRRHQRRRRAGGGRDQHRRATTPTAWGTGGPAIAAEKAGIVKPGSHLVLGEPDPELRPLFAAEGPAETVGARRGLRRRDRPAGARRPRRRPAHAVRPARGRVPAGPRRPPGRQRGGGGGRGRGVLRPGAATPTWWPRRSPGCGCPGRFEVVHRAPLLVLDGAHNADGAATVAATLADEFDVTGTRRWVLGMLAGRDLDEMLDALGVRPGDRVVATTPPSPRGVPAAELAAARRATGAIDVEAIAVGRPRGRAGLAARRGGGRGRPRDGHRLAVHRRRGPHGVSPPGPADLTARQCRSGVRGSFRSNPLPQARSGGTCLVRVGISPGGTVPLPSRPCEEPHLRHVQARRRRARPRGRDRRPPRAQGPDPRRRRPAHGRPRRWPSSTTTSTATSRSSATWSSS